MRWATLRTCNSPRQQSLAAKGAIACSQEPLPFILEGGYAIAIMVAAFRWLELARGLTTACAPSRDTHVVSYNQGPAGGGWRASVLTLLKKFYGKLPAIVSAAKQDLESLLSKLLA